jgi:drug/metabolite transporter (DMT)-like permease
VTAQSQALPGVRPISGTFLPILFILMWSSGYIAGKIAVPYAGPFTLVFIRFAVAAIILLLVSLITRASWPDSPARFLHIVVVGVLIQAVQFSGLYSGISLGVSAGVSALIVGTMPVFTALGAYWVLNERITWRQWLGLLIGLVGVALVVAHKVHLGEAGFAGYAAVVLALIGITCGTLYQKRFCVGMDIRTGGFIQLTVASVITFVLAQHYEHLAVNWSREFVMATGWMSLVNSIGAISVLYLLIRRGEASRVASLFYLIPPVTAVMAYLVLDETLSPLAFVGFAATATGVWLSSRP